MKRRNVITAAVLVFALVCGGWALSADRSASASPAASEAVKESVAPIQLMADAGGEPAAFTDVDENAWYAKAAAYAQANGLMDGTGEGKFDPTGTLTRAMMVTVLYRFAGEPAVTGGSGFQDVKTGAWYEKAVTWAQRERIVTGYGNGSFGVDDPLTREQMAAVLWRYAGEPEVSETAAFADETSVSRWAKTAVAWARENSVINGVGDNRFDPKGTANRAQLAQVLMNSIENGVLTRPEPTDGPAEEPASQPGTEPTATPTETPATDSVTTNGGQVISLSSLEHYSEAAASTVYYISTIDSASLIKAYEALDWSPTGTLAVKVSTGEPPASNYLRADLIGQLVQSLDGTIVECNTAYGGSRASTAAHKQVAADHGFAAISKGGQVDIMDENGSATLQVVGGSRLTENYVGANFENYGSFLILSHFKGHSMAGFGGAIKNISIGIASSQGKSWIHSGGTSLTNPWGGEQTAFTESMAEAGKSVSDALGNGERIVYINVMNRLSIDCDCNGNPAEPDIHDIGILASTDPVALDQACVDIVSNADGSASLMNRIANRGGLHTLEHAEEIGLGSRAYNLVDLG